ncbi:multidrug resistance protein, MATE family [Pustulibacterium marinum]|uniref:Multidrug-efflux transporter n=1 Tax=Pustulibacterium marinum TaxID=1224947 RepID=A0A1I7F9C8_9FLAO|nr:MATE family efflux transporter [Pustulibacterium marinum]SFU32725.1 multidrug resistance protein, MATE family [Pustulibacterium marinum]
MLLSAYTKEFRYNLKLSYPVILGMVGHSLIGLFDNIMVGQLGTAELAAVSLGNSFVFIAMSLGIGFSTAITPLVAEADGENNKANVKAALKHGLVLCTILGIALFGILLFAKPLMYLMKQPDEVVELAQPYLDMVAFSLIPLIIFQAFKQFADGLSETRYAMYATFLAVFLNILINYLLIFGIWVFPEMGIMGASIGTLLSRIAMVVFMWWLLQHKQKFHDYVTHYNFKDLHATVIKKIMKLGFPSALQMFFEVAIFTAAIWLSGVLGKNPQAANQIALNLSSMTFMVATGLSVAAMIRVGNQKGKQAYLELRRIAKSVFLLAFVLSVGFALFFFLFRNELPKLYLDQNDLKNLKDNTEVLSIASQLLLVASIFQITDALQVVALGALRGLQDVAVPTYITMVSYWFIGFPISFYFGLYTDFGSQGIWFGLLAGLSSAALFLYLRFNYSSNKLIQTQTTA